jgi:hypothetical protein
LGAVFFALNKWKLIKLFKLKKDYGVTKTEIKGLPRIIEDEKYLHNSKKRTK